MENLNFHVLPNVISDRQRKDIKNLIRLRENDIELFGKRSIDKNSVFENLSKLNTPLYSNLAYKQKIVNKDVG